MTAIRNGICKSHCLIPCEAAVLPGICGDDVLQERQTLGVQFAGLAGSKFGAELLHDSHIVGILESVYHN